MDRTVGKYSEIVNKTTKKLLSDICKEHHQVSKQHSNLTYLWFMYTEGTKSGTYKPFILASEINLLVKMKMIDKNDRNRMFSQMKSDDSENLYMLFLAIKSLREKRIKDLGIFTTDNINYNDIKYDEDIINHSIFNKL